MEKSVNYNIDFKVKKNKEGAIDYDKLGIELKAKIANEQIENMRDKIRKGKIVHSTPRKNGKNLFHSLFQDNLKIENRGGEKLGQLG